MRRCSFHGVACLAPAPYLSPCTRSTVQALYRHGSDASLALKRQGTQHTARRARARDHLTEACHSHTRPGFITVLARKRLPPKQLNAHYSRLTASLGLFAHTRLAAAFGHEPVLVYALQPAPLLAVVSPAPASRTSTLLRKRMLAPSESWSHHGKTR